MSEKLCKPKFHLIIAFYEPAKQQQQHERLCSFIANNGILMESHLKQRIILYSGTYVTTQQHQ